MALFDEARLTSALGLAPTDDQCEWQSPTLATIQGREISLPLEVADCSLLLNLFWVDVHAARALVGDSGLFVPAPLPGRTLLLLLAVKYRDSPLGDYGEAAVLFPADVTERRLSFTPFGLLSMLSGATPQLVYRMPVDQEFTMHAGRFLWGYPKYLARIDVGFDERRAEARLEEDGRLVFALSAPASASGRLPETQGRNLTVRGGIVRSIRAAVSGTGTAFSLGGAPPVVGDDAPLARELRALGLPKKPIAAASIRNARFRFGPPVVEQRG